MIFSWRFPSHGDTETSSSRHGIPGDPRCTEGDVPDRLIVSQVGPQAPPKAEAMIWSLVQPKKSWEHLSVHLRSIISEYNIYMYHSLSRRYLKKNTQTLDPVLAYHEKSNNFLKQTFMEVCPISISQMGSWGRNTGDARVVSTSGAECHDFSGNIDMTSLVINPYTLW